MVGALGGVRWRLGGSALLAALELTDEVGDLDVMVGAGDLDAVRTALQPWDLDVTVGGAPHPWCSDWIARGALHDVDLDVIGGFCVVTDAGRVEVPLSFAGHLDLDGARVPLADPAVWWWIYQAYRPAKADLLAEVVPAERRAAVVRELGPPGSSAGRR